MQLILQHFRGSDGRSTEFNWPLSLLEKVFLLDREGRAERMRFGYMIMDEWDSVCPNSPCDALLRLSRETMGHEVVDLTRSDAGEFRKEINAPQP